MVRTGTPSTKQKADGRLASNPAPLTLEDLEKQPVGSPHRTVMQVMFWTQWGNVPGIVELYDRRIVDVLGVSRITSAYDHLRREVSTSRPRIVATRRNAGGQWVAVELASTREPPVRESFLLRRRDGRWRVVYDTLLERAMEASILGGQVPGDPAPTADVRRSAASAAELYRSAYPMFEIERRDEAAAG